MNCDRRVQAQGKPCMYYIPFASRDGVRMAGFCQLPGMFRCIEAVKSFAPRLSHSGINQWMRCRLSYKFSQLFGIQRREEFLSVPLKLGSIWDTVMSQMHELGEWDVGLGLESIDASQEKYALEPIDRAKLRALTRALGMLEFRPEKCKSGVWIEKYSEKFERHYFIAGKLDAVPLSGKPYFYEFKMSGRPDYYDEMFNLESQIGTYFLQEEYDAAVVQVTRAPALKQLGNKSDEGPESYEDRVYDDAIRRPGHYFIHWDNVKKRWGRQYYKREFDTASIEGRFHHLSREIPEAIQSGALYGNPGGCHNPGNCDFIDACKTGKAGEQLYRIKSWEETMEKEGRKPHDESNNG